MTETVSSDPATGDRADAPASGVGADQSAAGDHGVAAGLAALALEMRRDREIALRRQRRARTWSVIRWIAYALIFVGVIGVVATRFDIAKRDHIARFDVVGGIVDDPDRDKLLADIARDDSAKALIVRIDSPGGTTVGGEALYESLRAVAEAKPVVAVMGEVAASAAYMTAIAADRIVARNNTITASIGVIFTAPNIHDTLELVGVDVVELKSGVNKAEPSPFQPVDPNRLTLERELIGEIFDWFLALVRERRELSADAVALIRDGRVVTGRQALELGMVDEIGGEQQAVAWLESERGLAPNLPVTQRKINRERPSLLRSLVGGSVEDAAAAATRGVGSALVGEAGDAGVVDRLRQQLGGGAPSSRLD